MRPGCSPSARSIDGERLHRGCQAEPCFDRPSHPLGLTRSTAAATAGGTPCGRHGHRAATWQRHLRRCRCRARWSPPQAGAAPLQLHAPPLPPLVQLLRLVAARMPRRRLLRACLPSRWRTARPCAPLRPGLLQGWVGWSGVGGGLSARGQSKQPVCRPASEPPQLRPHRCASAAAAPRWRRCAHAPPRAPAACGHGGYKKISSFAHTSAPSTHFSSRRGKDG